jgi:thiazole synthase
MAGAFAMAVEAGRAAFRAGLGAERANAEASSPITGFLEHANTSQADQAVTGP